MIWWRSGASHVIVNLNIHTASDNTVDGHLQLSNGSHHP